jgi:hypothetical protein
VFYPSLRTQGATGLIRPLGALKARIINEVYTDRVSRSGPESHLRKLDDDLRQWRLAIPDHLLFDPEDPNAAARTPTLLSLQ